MASTIAFFIVIIATAFTGYYMHFLTLSGCIAAAIVGIFIYLGFDWQGLMLLGLFFATSSFWSIFKKSKKASVDERLEKGTRRDWQQVLANGGVAAICSLFYCLTADPNFMILFAIALGSANSDTWASEIGTLSKKPPVSIRTWSQVPKGTSGAISGLGTVAGGLGALLIAVSSALLFSFPPYLVMWIWLFGFLGNVIDTIIGAYFQAVYRCPNCKLETEKRMHCGEMTELIRGVVALDNDAVNFLSSFLAVLFALACLYMA